MFCFLFLYGEMADSSVFTCMLLFVALEWKCSSLSNFDIPPILSEVTIMCGIHTMNNIYSLIHSTIRKEIKLFNENFLLQKLLPGLALQKPVPLKENH